MLKWLNWQYDKSTQRQLRQKESHLRLQKHTATEVLKLTVPAHRPIKRSTLAHILKQALHEAEEFKKLK
jgi:predicted RNA binding protein YcfA (HicA-like mRNA interferase family)